MRIFILLCGLATLLTCQSNDTQALDDPTHCYTPIPGLPVGFAAAQLDKALETIQVDSLQLNNTEDMVWIEGGSFEMGGDNDQARPDEWPKHPTSVDGFWMDETEVTNAQFQAFVDATGYVTIAEQEIKLEDIMSQLPEGTPPPPAEALIPFSLVFQTPQSPKASYGVQDWWAIVPEANWRQPQGPGSSIKGKG